MDFSSDTSAPAHPAVMQAVAAANQGNMASYGDDELTALARQKIADVFETDDLDIWLCASGTAANALALSCFCPPTGAVLCHADAHIAVDERGAPEFFSGGGKLQLLGGPYGKIAGPALRAALDRINHGFVHETPAHVLSLTNLTESGCAYTSDEIALYSKLAHASGLSVHLDGARLANALVGQGLSPADMTSRAGVDVLTLGLTKTGALGCEVIILFGGARAKYGELKARAKRAGHMPAKMRFLAAQAVALLSDNLWLELAGQANAAAQDLADVLCGTGGGKLTQPVEGNEVFVDLTHAVVESLKDDGNKFYPWPDGSYRFVCAWSTQDRDIEALKSCLRDQ